VGAVVGHNGGMWVVFVVVAVGVVIAVALLAVGRLGQLPEVVPDRAPLDLPDGEIDAGDIESVRFAVGLRGYRMDQVDEVLDRAAEGIAVRDARIRELEELLDERAVD